ncbi:hypothetical protein PF011_g2511 [Phytophthora fragariae]|nr:hypothetical protein PF003_g21136 [Phytophthora fragariae]KAE9026486.1 hypothetical protein PF011_g2511 [Phytophthora fragariae]
MDQFGATTHPTLVLSTVNSAAVVYLFPTSAVLDYALFPFASAVRSTQPSTLSSFLTTISPTLRPTAMKATNTFGLFSSVAAFHQTQSTTLTSVYSTQTSTLRITLTVVDNTAS